MNSEDRIRNGLKKAAMLKFQDIGREPEIIHSIISLNEQNVSEVAQEVIKYLKNSKYAQAKLVVRAVEISIVRSPKKAADFLSFCKIIQASSDEFDNDGDKYFTMSNLVQNISERIHYLVPQYEKGTIEWAIFNDRLEVLQDMSPVPTSQMVSINPYRCELFPSVCINLLQFSAYCGSPKCFKYLIKVIGSISDLLPYAIVGGNQEIIEQIKASDALFDDCVELCVAYHRNNILEQLLNNPRCLKIPAFYFLNSLNETALLMLLTVSNDEIMKYTLLEECLQQEDTPLVPELSAFISKQMQKTVKDFKLTVFSTYVNRYKAPSVTLTLADISDLMEENMSSADFKMKVFFRVKGPFKGKGNTDDKLGSIFEDKKSDAYRRARELIAIGDQKHIFPKHKCNIFSIRSINDILNILPGWEKGVTVFDMKEQLGEINCHSFKQRFQKTGLCYLHAVVVYLYYAVRRNNKSFDEVIDIAEMIKTKFTSDQIYNYIANDNGGSSVVVLEYFAGLISRDMECSIDSIPVVSSISVKFVTEDMFISYGPFVLSGFDVYNDFYTGNQISFTSASSPSGECIGKHAMLVIGVRKSTNGELIFLIQNWWEEKQIVEMSQLYLMQHHARVCYIDPFNLVDYKRLSITSTTAAQFVETSVDSPERMPLERL